jgi:hypothetical protein
MTVHTSTPSDAPAQSLIDTQGQDQIRESEGTLRTAKLLGWVTALIAMVAAVWTFADAGLLHGPEAMQGSARGTALVVGAVAVPVLLVAVWRASRNPGAALLVWAGALLYLVYNAVLFLFLTPFNAAFLVYVALLGSALWAIGYLGSTRELWRAGRAVAERAPVRGVAAYVWVIAAVNAAVWLAVLIPSLAPYPTPMLEGVGVQTNAIYIQDLAVWLPLAAVAALWLRRRQPRGAVVVASVLALWVIEGVSVAVDQWFGAHADPTSSVVSLTLVAPFLALAAVGLVPLWLLLRLPAHATNERHNEKTLPDAGEPPLPGLQA